MPEFHTPREAFIYQLGASLRMERTALEILQLSNRTAREDVVLDLLERLQADAAGRIARIEQIFQELKETAIESPSPAMHGIKKGIHEESKLMGREVSDLAILQGALETGYYELGVYVNLKVSAHALERRRIARTLDGFVTELKRTLEDSVSLQARLATGRPTSA